MNCEKIVNSIIGTKLLGPMIVSLMLHFKLPPLRPSQFYLIISFDKLLVSIHVFHSCSIGQEIIHFITANGLLLQIFNSYGLLTMIA